MKVDHNKMVSVSYTLTVNGQVEDQADASNPLKFAYGHGQLLPAFEEALLGLEPSQTFQMDLTPEQGYGEYEERNQIKVPRSLFHGEATETDELLQVGNAIPMTTHQGATMVGTVLSVEEEFVLMDFNHPLAGETLHFEGTVVEVRDLSFEEIQELLSHHGGGCGGGCSCGHHEEEEACGSHGCGGCGCH